MRFTDSFVDEMIPKYGELVQFLLNEPISFKVFVSHFTSIPQQRTHTHTRIISISPLHPPTHVPAHTHTHTHTHTLTHSRRFSSLSYTLPSHKHAYYCSESMVSCVSCWLLLCVYLIPDLTLARNLNLQRKSQLMGLFDCQKYLGTIFSHGDW